MSLRPITTTPSSGRNRLVDVLTVGSKVGPSTGANGDDSPAMNADNWKKDQFPKMFKRFQNEYESIINDHELLPNTVSVSWTAWDNESDKMMPPMQWTFVVAPWNFELVVRFPSEYPFKPPYYFVKTKDGTEMDMKRYFMHVTTEEGPNGKSFRSGFKEKFDYVRENEMVKFLGQLQHSPGMTVGSYISKLLNDKTLMWLLAMAPFTQT